MERSTAIHLIKNDQINHSIPSNWADLGCGSGLFTFALANLLSPGSTIYAVDKVPVRLDPSVAAEAVEIKTSQLDFVHEKPPYHHLDGLLMANSLHYVQDKLLLINKLPQNIQPDGRFLIVEYDTNTPVPQWVPYPISFLHLPALFAKSGYTSVEKLGEHPSIYGRANLYAALISR